MSTSTHIVTGATGGIGGAIVDALVSRGLEHVTLACRCEEKTRTLVERHKDAATRLEFVPLDLMSLASVEAFADTLAEKGYIIDTLYNNAGTMPGRKIISEDGYESATQTNFLAPALLTTRLLPLMGHGSRIVFTTSLTRRIVWLHDDWRQRSEHHHSRFVTYGRSKLMLTYWAAQLAESLKPRGILVNCADPGAVNTRMTVMGNAVVDRLADWVARPLFSRPDQGAEPALMAGQTPLTGRIFTRVPGRTLCGRIPRRYYGSALPTQVIDALEWASMSEKFNK